MLVEVLPDGTEVPGGVSVAINPVVPPTPRIASADQATQPAPATPQPETAKAATTTAPETAPTNAPKAASETAPNPAPPVETPTPRLRNADARPRGKAAAGAGRDRLAETALAPEPRCLPRRPPRSSRPRPENCADTAPAPSPATCARKHAA